MNPKLHADILDRLNEFGFKKKKGAWLQEGECPSCKKHELFVSAEKPWILRCGRVNKCGYEESVRDRYPDLFESWSDRHPPLKTEPNATADAYMADGRGFDLALVRGSYTQEAYYDQEQKIGSATVRFQVGPNVWWERIIDRPWRFGKRKANFRGAYGGLWWCPPGLDLGGVEQLWIVEGIFDAWALMHKGVAAVSTLSTVNYPSDALARLAQLRDGDLPELVWAFDSDKAGRSFISKWVERSTQEGWTSKAAQIPMKGGKKRDWNDAMNAGVLEPEHLDDYLYHGALLIAPTAQAKANLIYSRGGAVQFPFDFDSRYYWFKLDLEALGRERQAVEERLEKEGRLMSPQQILEEAMKAANCVTEVANCRPEPLYYLKNEVTDESWYYFRIEFPHDGKPVKGNFSAGQLSASAEFKKRLLHLGAGAIWTGSAGQLDRLLSRWTYGIKTVETIDFLGYSIKHGAYVYDKVAIQGEKVVTLNDEDYFDLGKLSIKSLSKSIKLDLNTDLREHRTDWLAKLHFCFGARGIVVLAYWLGTLHAEQIRERFESLPFLEIVGVPGSGKSTLLEFLWRLLGRNSYEGYDPAKATNAGFLRSMAQVANLPVVLIESDRSDDSDGSTGRTKQAFHWDSLKSLFNGGNLRTTGVKAGGLDTYEPQFRAALCISQNAPVSASPAIMERIVHVWLDKAHQTDAGRDTALELNRMTTTELSGFLIKAVTTAPVIDVLDKKLREFEKRLRAAGVSNIRVQKNHGQLMAFVEALGKVCPITPAQQAEAQQLLVDMALERERTLSRDHPVVEQFWEAFDYLDGVGAKGDGESVLNHARSDELIAVNLNHFVQVASERRQQVPLLNDLKRHLKDSRARKFIEANRAVNSGINARWNQHHCDPMRDTRRPATVKCWVFEAPGRKAASNQLAEPKVNNYPSK